MAILRFLGHVDAPSVVQVEERSPLGRAKLRNRRTKKSNKPRRAKSFCVRTRSCGSLFQSTRKAFAAYYTNAFFAMLERLNGRERFKRIGTRSQSTYVMSMGTDKDHACFIKQTGDENGMSFNTPA
ncbi:hypothetical protein ARMSODRAFT_1004968 [Armillaria solidipes]|uniref:Uncharacterized protein n=1 Tax=Armillaria solidipes TaxID=1076256 RepID=A0A2H3BMW4_9AGAR|nr:hypothetical protein ARMSODRAFT_1004968 [Armillaria solidipes]